MTDAPQSKPSASLSMPEPAIHPEPDFSLADQPSLGAPEVKEEGPAPAPELKEAAPAELAPAPQESAPLPAEESLSIKEPLQKETSQKEASQEAPPQEASSRPSQEAAQPTPPAQISDPEKTVEVAIPPELQALASQQLAQARQVPAAEATPVTPTSTPEPQPPAPLEATQIRPLPGRRLAPPLDAKEESPASPPSSQEVTPVNAEEPSLEKLPPAPPPSEEPPAASSSSKEGTVHDLALGLIYLLFLGGLILWGANSLLTWKNDIDVLPTVSYDQLTWSQKGEKLAFLRVAKRQISSGMETKSALWVANRFGEGVSCLEPQLPPNYQILGWFKDDSRLLLLSPAASTPSAPNYQPRMKPGTSSFKLFPASAEKILAPGQNPSGVVYSAIEVDVKRQTLNYWNLAALNLKVVGCDSDEVFLVEHLDQGQGRDFTNLLSWKPGSTKIEVVTTIPSRQDETMTLQQVAASPDDKQLAIVISTKDDTPASGAKNSDSPLGVWIYDRPAKELKWTSLATQTADSLDVVWAPDSSWLGGVARYAEEDELFAYHAPEDCQAAKLHGLPQGTELRPFIHDGEHSLTFISSNRIDRYHFDTQEDIPLLSADNLGVMPYHFAVSPNGAVAYVASHYNAPNIYICTLNNTSSTVVNIPVDSVKHTTLYRLVGHLQYAIDYWRFPTRR